MRAQHTTHALPGFPVYSIGFTADDKLALGGGGGASKSGIKNKIVSPLWYIGCYAIASFNLSDRLLS